MQFFALNSPTINVLLPLQHENTISVAILLQEMTVTLGIPEIGQQKKMPTSMAVKKSPKIAPNLEISH